MQNDHPLGQELTDKETVEEDMVEVVEERNWLNKDKQDVGREVFEEKQKLKKELNKQNDFNEKQIAKEKRSLYEERIQLNKEKEEMERKKPKLDEVQLQLIILILLVQIPCSTWQ
jgi:hypothetical protein